MNMHAWLPYAIITFKMARHPKHKQASQWVLRILIFPNRDTLQSNEVYTTFCLSKRHFIIKSNWHCQVDVYKNMFKYASFYRTYLKVNNHKRYYKIWKISFPDIFQNYSITSSFKDKWQKDWNSDDCKSFTIWFSKCL